MFHSIASKIKKEISGGLAKEYASKIYSTDRYNSFDKFHETAKYCAEVMESIGLVDVEVLSYRADGRTAYGDWIIPRAWDVEDAELEIVEPAEFAGTIVRYREEPACLFMLSAPTPKDGVEAEIVRVEDCTDPKDYAGKDINGKIIFTSTRPYKVKEYLLNSGAIGLICDEGRITEPDLIVWDNYSFAPRNDKGLFGFSISKNQGLRLKRIMKMAETSGRKVKVKATIKARLYDGTADVVTGVLPGRRRDEEVLALAHLYEIGANDNASGVGLTLETMRTLRTLIAENKLEKPKRSIRALFGFECCGFMAYVMDHPEIIKRQVAAINPDMVGENQEKCGSILRIHLTPGSNPSYIDALIKIMVEEIICQENPFFRWKIYPFVICDSFIADPMIGVPSVSLMQMPDRYYHSSMDTPDKIDPESMRQIGTVIGTYLYFIANAGVKEGLWLAELVKDQALKEMIEEKIRFTASLLSMKEHGRLGEAAREFLERMNYLTYRNKESIKKILKITGEDPKVKEALQLNMEEISKGCRRQIMDARRIVRKAGLEWKVKRRKPTKLELKAASMIPERLKPGPLTLETLPEEARFKERWKPSWQAYFNVNLYWADGKRSVLEIYRWSRHETGRVKLEDLIDYLEFLEKYGYVRLKRKVE